MREGGQFGMECGVRMCVAQCGVAWWSDGVWRWLLYKMRVI